MKKLSLILLLSLFSLAASYILKSRAAEPSTFQISEFATIRWAGRDNTHLILPSGKVEKLKQLFERFPRPEGRIMNGPTYMSIAITLSPNRGLNLLGESLEMKS